MLRASKAFSQPQRENMALHVRDECQQIAYKNNSYGKSCVSGLNSLATALQAIRQMRPLRNQKKRLDTTPLFPQGLPCLACSNDWIRLKLPSWTTFFLFFVFCINSEYRWVCTYEESVQLKRNKSQFYCKMECSVNKCCKFT